MGSDRYHWDLVSDDDACPAQLAAANAKIAELERELADARRQRDAAEFTLKSVAEQRDQMRAAQSADKERMRSVVEAEAAAVLGPNGPLTRSWDVLASTIASRVADQLATARVGLSILDRAELDSLLGYLVEERDVAYDDGRSSDARAYRDWHAALSKLLGIP